MPSQISRILSTSILLVVIVVLLDSGCTARAKTASDDFTSVSRREKAGTHKTTMGARVLAAALKYRGVRFQVNGRSKKGVDAAGLVFLSYRDATGKDYKQLSTWPRILIETEALGKLVAGLEGVIKGMIDFGKIAEGDIIFFLIPFRVGSDADPLVVINKVDYWAWTIGISAGQGRCLYVHQDDRVRLESIDALLGENDAIFVTRLE